MAHNDKINGFDKWDIESAADTLIKAETIRNDKRKGYYGTVQKAVVKKAKDADQAAAVANKVAKDGTVRKISVGGLFKTASKGNPGKGTY